jgi:tRNA G18 (ribose-2'-O)-methylase SpoU
MTGKTRGYFSIGVEGISKPMNLGNLFRSAHAFGAASVFTINADFSRQRAKSDTSLVADNLPYYRYDKPEDLVLADGCRLIGVELLDESTVLPSFRHPRRAAYVLGPERGELSPALLARCDAVVKIPTSFCINVATAGAILMYDRMISLGRFAERPVRALGEPEPLADHVFGAPARRGRGGG